MVTNHAAASLARHCWVNAMGPAIERKAAAAAAVAAWAPLPGTAGRYGVVRKAWTAADDAILFEPSMAEAAVILDRTLKAVSIRRWRLAKGIVSGHQRPGRLSEEPPEGRSVRQ